MPMPKLATVARLLDEQLLAELLYELDLLGAVQQMVELLQHRAVLDREYLQGYVAIVSIVIAGTAIVSRVILSKGEHLQGNVSISPAEDEQHDPGRDLNLGDLVLGQLVELVVVSHVPYSVGLVVGRVGEHLGSAVTESMEPE